MKHRVKCIFKGVFPCGEGKAIALVDRLTEHPKLGPPRCESSTRTSLVLRVDYEKKELETLNTIYYWS